MINSDAKSKIDKCIDCTYEKYSYALSLEDYCALDSIRIIFLAKKELESLD